MSAIDKLKAATAALSGVEIEIDNEHLGKLRVKPALSCAARQEIRDTENEHGLIRSMCHEITLRCLGEDGKPLFVKTDAVTMMAEIGDDIVIALYNQMKDAQFAGKSTAATSKSTSG